MLLKFISATLLGVSAAALAQQPLSPGEHTATLNGVRLWYKIAGTAKLSEVPILYLHGGPGYNSYSFEKTIGPSLERHAQMIYLDERGSGRSERPQNTVYSLPALVSDIEALRQSLGVPQFTLMGHSFGGTIALEYAAKFPEHVHKLIILDGAADMPTIFRLWREEIEQRYPDAWQSALSTSSGKAYQEVLKRQDACSIAKAEFALEMQALQSVDGQAFHYWQQFHNQQYQRQQSDLDAASGLRNTGEIGGYYFGPQSSFPCYRFTAFSKLNMPTLIIVGKYDGAIGVAQMETLTKNLPNAHLDEFPRSGHFTYAEEPAKFDRDVTEFLSKP